VATIHGGLASHGGRGGRAVNAVRGEWAAVQEGWGRLLVKWGAGDTATFDALKCAFRARFPMATWDRTAAAWSVPASQRAQLAAFLAAHFADPRLARAPAHDAGDVRPRGCL
jgi:hypothetical protein